MSLSIGMKAEIRSLIFVAGETIPLFWPMRSFIHHNPLQGLEKLSFKDAIAEGEKLFHGRGFLHRNIYQRYYNEEKISHQSLSFLVEKFLSQHEPIAGIDIHSWLMALLTKVESPLTVDDSRCTNSLASSNDIAAVIRGEELCESSQPDVDALTQKLCGSLLNNSPLYERLDSLFDTEIGEELDELVIKSCLNFFDEGQSAWGMPNRKDGFFSAWREVSFRNLGILFKGRRICEILEVSEDPEGIIVYVMERLNIPKERWMSYFRRELSVLHGWAGFIRWRSNARHYFQGVQHPGDLVDFLAVRLTLALALIDDRARKGIPSNLDELQAFVKKHPMQACLRHQLYGRTINPRWAQKVEQAILTDNAKKIDELGLSHMQDKRVRDATILAKSVSRLAECANAEQGLKTIPDENLSSLLFIIRDLEQQEGMIWLEAMEATAIDKLLNAFQDTAPVSSDKRPFVQALFCIDVRSERLRRHLEGVGDYQTFGIAGFFGVPVSFVELGKGTEAHLCPVLLTPKNLAMEMTVNEFQDSVAFTVMEKAVHKLKETILSPFVTVEAIGWIFGFDMVGKTLAPRKYNRWRSGLHQHKPHTHLLIDKLSRSKADSIVRAVQRAVVAQAIELEFEVPPERIKDDLVRELREAALGHDLVTPLLLEQLKLDNDQARSFIKRLRKTYHINPYDARMQMERLGRIGFSLEEQVVFVSQALHAIGLVKNFSRFILVVGHGSQSENNPYESALDCGACGGNVGEFNARILALMANKPAVRQRLRNQGVNIPDDSWFVPAMHNTTTDEVELHDLNLLPSTHPIYLDRLRGNLVAASRLCAQERVPSLDFISDLPTADNADKQALRNAMDWSQVRPEWGLSRNVYFIIGRRSLTKTFSLDGRAFLHSYDYRVDSKLLLLENILTGPLVVGQWINMEHYFSTVDNDHYGSGSKVYHNVAGRFGVMTGNLSDLRTGLPAQTVLADGRPYHEPMRLITLIEAPFDHVVNAIYRVSSVKRLMHNGWIRVLIRDPQTGLTHIYSNGDWQEYHAPDNPDMVKDQEALAL
ncbi:MAG: DUF2309 domain-containing protein [Gammaproteobacteria bacterium]|nr:DUF2309 domain-containing protein [Gammaproteobacteria bacterium]NNJ51412.1 DUF2309 domain-containing protein [Gammaproteobacteria bacterium]